MCEPQSLASHHLFIHLLLPFAPSRSNWLLCEHVIAMLGLRYQTPMVRVVMSGRWLSTLSTSARLICITRNSEMFAYSASERYPKWISLFFFQLGPPSSDPFIDHDGGWSLQTLSLPHSKSRLQVNLQFIMSSEQEWLPHLFDSVGRISKDRRTRVTDLRHRYQCHSHVVSPGWHSAGREFIAPALVDKYYGLIKMLEIEESIFFNLNLPKKVNGRMLLRDRNAHVWYSDPSTDSNQGKNQPEVSRPGFAFDFINVKTATIDDWGNWKLANFCRVFESNCKASHDVQYHPADNKTSRNPSSNQKLW